MPVEIIADAAALRHHIILRYQEGWTIRGLSSHYGVSRNRIRRMVRTAQALRSEGNQLPLRSAPKPRGSKLDPYMPRLREILEQYPRITAVRMLEELRICGYDGKITVLRKRLSEIRPDVQKPVIRFETDPGVQGQMDWSPYTIDFTQSGRTDVLCFSYILGFSRRQYTDFTLNRDFHTLIRKHRDAFEHFEGVPLQCLYDSEKTVVLRWEAAQPVYNPSFLDFITHYHCKPIACQRARPQTKGKIERPFQYVEGNLLNGRSFTDLEDLRAAAKWWMKEKSDLHIHDTTHKAPLELFMEQESRALQVLPQTPYDCAEVVFRICPVDLFINFETNLYSVPPGHIGEILAVKATDNEIFIYSPFVELLARHVRHARGACRKEEAPDHRKDHALRYGLEPVREAFLRIGDAAASFLEGLLKRHPRNTGLHARMILTLKEHYSADDINAALSHACAYWAFDASSIERILKARATERSLESQRNERARKELETTLPPIAQRPLAEYETIITGEADERQPTGSDTENQTPLPDAETDDH